MEGATTPTLIQHWERDSTVPPRQARLFYRTLRDQGVEAKLIMYDTGRFIGAPRQRVGAMKHNWDWFERHL